MQSKLLNEGLVPVYREEGSEEWRRVAHKVDLNRIVRLWIRRNITRDGSNGPSVILPHQIARSSLPFSTPGLILTITASSLQSKTSARRKTMSILKDQPSSALWRVGQWNLSLYPQSAASTLRISHSMMNTCFPMGVNPNSFFPIRKHLLLEPECIQVKYPALTWWPALSTS